MNDPASRPALAPEAFRRARAIFELALDWPPGERERLIRDECREDEGLASMVQAMLRADATRHTLLDGSPAVHADRWQPGDTFADRYRIVALLGRGGMGEVYRAQRRLLGLFSFAAAVFLTLPSHAWACERPRARNSWPVGRRLSTRVDGNRRLA